MIFIGKNCAPQIPNFHRQLLSSILLDLRRFMAALSHPSWYTIPQLNFHTFVSIVKPLYDIKDGKKHSKSEPDAFAKECWMAANNISNEDWERLHKHIQCERAWTMEMGNLHQNIMGSLPGWKNLMRGHSTGCDISSDDETVIGEIKNNINTMNSSSKEAVINKLKKQAALGKRTLLIIVNGDTPHKMVDGVEYISGRMFYAEASNNPTFYDDLLYTLKECFKTCPQYEELRRCVGERS